MTALAESLRESSELSKLFFVLSGEHSTLPAAEVRAILDSEAFEHRNQELSYRLLTLEASARALEFVANRSLMYNSCGVELSRSEASEESITGLVKDLPLGHLVKNVGSFAVRSMRLGGVSKRIRLTKLEKELGSYIKRLIPRLQVRLSQPDVTFASILFDDQFLFGISAHSKPPGLIAPRLPRKRAVFHPSTMPPKIARCMVNLSRAKAGSTFADPFAGVGGVLIEAAMIGCNVVGTDASLRMLRGARKNIKHFRSEALGLLHADARKMPLRGLDAIATDPPYGRDSSTMGVKVIDLVNDFLDGARLSLRPGAHLCICAPVELDIEGYAAGSGFTLLERHLAKVHRSLTRQFVILQNS